MVQLTLILDNLRSAYNVGSILRTADAVGVERVICCGSTPYPQLVEDPRDPVVIGRNMREIAKTALGAERSLKIEYINDTHAAIAQCHEAKRTIYGLEQAPKAHNIFEFAVQLPAALVLGNEPNGIAADVLQACDDVLQIPQHGSKESLNVAVAAGIAMYRFLQ